MSNRRQDPWGTLADTRRGNSARTAEVEATYGALAITRQANRDAQHMEDLDLAQRIVEHPAFGTEVLSDEGRAFYRSQVAWLSEGARCMRLDLREKAENTLRRLDLREKLGEPLQRQEGAPVRKAPVSLATRQRRLQRGYWREAVAALEANTWLNDPAKLPRTPPPKREEP